MTFDVLSGMLNPTHSHSLPAAVSRWIYRSRQFRMVVRTLRNVHNTVKVAFKCENNELGTENIYLKTIRVY